MNIPEIHRHIIENMESDKYYEKFKEVIMSCYFTEKVDPVHHSELENKKQETNNYNYIKPLYETCLEKNLHLIIFYDNLSDEFINKYQTEKIIFRKTKLVGALTINDERYVIYYEYLLHNPYEKILTSDVSDVYINKNPFELFETFWVRDEEKKKEALEILNNQKKYKKSSFKNNIFSLSEINRFLHNHLDITVSKDEKIFVGSNTIGNNVEETTKKWFERRIDKINRFNLALEKFGKNYPKFETGNFQIYNPGTIMASYKKYITFIEKFLEILFVVSQERQNYNWNMIINTYIIINYFNTNLCLNTYCTDEIYTGFPFTSMYQRKEIMGQSEACLIHK